MNTPSGRPVVLVVDDEESNIDTFRRLFRKELVVHGAPSGQQGLDLLGRQEFHVVVVDYAMPEMDGLEFLKRAAVVQPSLGALMITAHADLPALKDARGGIHISAVILKPYDPDTVLRWIMLLYASVHG